MKALRLGITGTVALIAAGSIGAASAGTFPDFGYQPPTNEYAGPLFELSQNYPQQMPPASHMPVFFKLLPTTLTPDMEAWRPYMMAVRKYCLEGNVKVDWRVQDNPVRHWYHMPWQHYGPFGREGIHGLTKEAEIKPKQLAPTQVTSGQTYAVGIYNELGGYVIGQAWKDPQNPNPAVTSKPNSFPDGTVVCKALFADVDLAEVPSLANPVLWQAYTTDSFSSANRSVKKVALIQLDFAVRDSRIPETGWIFGTFQYNGALSSAPTWKDLVPVGVMWGNDPSQTGNEYTNPQPAVTKINPQLKQSAINTRPELPPTHLGWNGRLAGPVDNPVSSCLSCHLTAEYPQLAPMNPTFQANPPPVGSAEWMRWFQNEPAGQPFSEGAESTDYSLQLAVSMQNFYSWKCDQGGVFADGGNACKKAESKLLLKRGKPAKIFPILRDKALNELE